MSGNEARRLFDAAFELSADRREAFLEAKCTDPALREEVRALLAAHDDAGSFLGELDQDKAAALTAGVDDPIEGRRIGPYRVLRELGRGGMGVVYLAERADGQFDQRVALKLIKRGMDSDEIHRRFLVERQILARLQHPNIAGLMDGGFSDDGRPYFAMEHVEGMPLARYCDTRRLEIDERLRLFREVATGVQFAHQKLVVHRDLKPSNILVSRDGVPKLLDFGIAKLLDTDDAGATGLTRTGQRLVTPGYGAPEQVRGEPVTTATDIYALGVVLYELLTGKRPYKVEGVTPEDLARAITETDVSRPSAVVSAARLQRQLKGDLDTIVLKALRKEPERRYASVEAMLEDLDRHAAGLPVRARPDTLAYRAGKFVRRHRLGVAAASLVTISMIVGMSVAIWQARVASRQAARSAEVLRFILQSYEEVSPDRTGGEEITAREVLMAGANRVETELADQPEIRAEIMFTIGNLLEQLGLWDDSATMHEKALGVRREILGNRHIDIARSLVALGGVQRRASSFEEAEPVLREALDIHRRLGADDPEYGDVLNTLALMLSELARYDEAEPFYEEAKAFWTRTRGYESAETRLILHNQGQHYKWKGDPERAEELYLESLEIGRKVLGPEHTDILQTMNNLGSMFGQLGRFEEAAEWTGKSLELRRKILGVDHPDTAITTNNYGMMMFLITRYEEAEKQLREALRINRLHFGDEHQRVAHNMANLARIIMESGAYAEALAMHEESLAQRRKLLGDDHPDVGLGLSYIAEALCYANRPADAEAAAREALSIQQEIYDPGHMRLGDTFSHLGRALIAQGRHAEAEAALRQGLSIQEAALAAGSWKILVTRSLLGECLARLGRHDEAAELLRSSHAALVEDRGPQHRHTLHAEAALKLL